MPVFPDVASMIVIPGLNRPSLSADSMICLATRSLILPPGFKNSALANTFPEDSLPNRTSGVHPTASRMDSTIIEFSFSPF
jgi:hypothetical protein